MAGFFGIGGKTKYVDEPEQPTQSNGNGKSGAFFLEPDDAKSLGNIEFMRKAYKIKRSFPKTLKGAGTEVIAEISSLKKALAKGETIAIDTTSESSQTSAANSARRSADDSMDMFRKMAKDIKK
ncbi:hypothetical protein [Gloeothece verrucosa]|uniref:Uncharacterized protein n=1 Tax=Gloeothece verrucosa (strain PCC 7822) TaxID=497965 RepID=E0U6G3_GLOV7|nr:hypothetical protein [Gloeothece verrucosa]ADN13606.1 conserved hypothetical protein [Gloeothece verrucosa PCC 7822]